MFWIIAAVILLFWLLGFVGHVGGDLIHLLLILVVAACVYAVVTGRRPQ